MHEECVECCGGHGDQWSQVSDNIVNHFASHLNGKMSDCGYTTHHTSPSSHLLSISDNGGEVNISITQLSITFIKQR